MVWCRLAFAFAVIILPYGAGAGWITYTGNDLAGGGIRVLAEDSRGAVWVGAGSGASRFDGLDWTTYTQTEGLPSSEILALLQTQDGFWAGTASGAAVFDGEAWIEDTSPSAPSGAVFRLAEDSSGTLWALSEHGVHCRRLEEWTVYDQTQGLPEALSDLMVTANDRVLVAAGNNSVFEWNGSEWDVLAGTQVGDNPFFFEDAENRVWIGHEDGHVLLERNGTSSFSEPSGCRAFTQDLSGTIWLGTRGGVYYFMNEEWFQVPDGNLADPRVDNILLDGRGHLWFGSSQTLVGVTRFDGSFWETFSTQRGLGAAGVSAALSDSRGGVWLASAASGSVVSRFDGEFWSIRSAPFGGNIRAMTLDPNGRYWLAESVGPSSFVSEIVDGTPQFRGGIGGRIDDLYSFGGTMRAAAADGIHRQENGQWVSEWDGIATSLAPDNRGSLLAGTDQGVLRLEESGWQPHFDQLEDVSDVLVDSRGQLWVASEQGLYDGQRLHSVDDGLPTDTVWSLLEDNDGAVWAGTDAGPARNMDGVWQTFETFPGFVSTAIFDIHQESSGVLWFATKDGALRFDGIRFILYTSGLAGTIVNALLQDPNGVLVFGGLGGLTLHGQDDLAPQTVLDPPLSALTASRELRATFKASFREPNVEFSTRLDLPNSGEAGWNPWSTRDFLLRDGLTDGFHILEVRARDILGNQEQQPLQFVFEVDATVEAAILQQPTQGQVVSGTVVIRGTAQDPRFSGYVVSIKPEAGLGWSHLAASPSPVIDSTLAIWPTAPLNDGNYFIRVIIEDALGTTTPTIALVTVDNYAPRAQETSPVRVNAADGGHVFTTENEVHVYIPERGLDQDAQISLNVLQTPEFPEAVVYQAVDVDLGGQANLNETGWIDFAVPDTLPTEQTLSAFYLDQDQWKRLGGSLDSERRRISTPLTHAGRYALAGGAPGLPQSSSLIRDLRVSPRAFSPAGSHSGAMAIHFKLAKEGVPQVRIYTRSGRLVRTVSQGQAMFAGDQTLFWDGKDAGGAVVARGLYLVAVEHDNERHVQAVSLVP